MRNRDWVFYQWCLMRTSLRLRQALFQEHDAFGHDCFAKADGADMLARFGFDSDIFICDIEDLGQPLSNRPLIRTELGLLSEDNAVEVDQAITVLLHRSPCADQHICRIA